MSVTGLVVDEQLYANGNKRISALCIDVGVRYGVWVGVGVAEQ